jgi:transposase
VRHVLRPIPTSGAVFAFRGRRGDPLPVKDVGRACLHAREGIKLLFWDGQGFCLYYKVLERGRFPWPTATAGCGVTDLGAVGDVVGSFRDIAARYPVGQ